MPGFYEKEALFKGFKATFSALRDATLMIDGIPFAEAFDAGDLEIELYCPPQEKRPVTHEHDEIYVVARGTGVFLLNDTKQTFQAGDFFFVPAGAAHHFGRCADEMAIWVIIHRKNLQSAAA